MKKSTGFLSIIVTILILSLLPVWVFGETEPTETIPFIEDAAVYGCYSADAEDAFLGDTQLIKNAKSVFLYELNTRTLMYAWEPDLQLPPSSFVKILTAIIAIENSNMDSAVTVTESALGELPESAVSVDLVINEVMPLKDLLYCMLVGSANDAAAVIAQYISGGQSLFAEKMNAFAKEIGCTGSHFTNPHGLHDPQQYTTARDTAKIMEYAMKNDTFREIFGATEYTVAATNKCPERYLITGNYTMSMDEVEIYFDERVIGGRTGVASDSTRCLITVAHSGSMELLCVVLGSESVYEEGGYRIRSFGGYNETKTLLDAGFTGHTATQIVYDGQALIQFEIPGGDSLLSAGSHASISTVLPEDTTLSNLSFRYSQAGQLRAPIMKGDKVGSVEVWHDGLLLGMTDLYAMNDVRDTSLVVLDVQDEKSILPVVILVITVIVLAVAAFVLYRTGRIRRFINRMRRIWRRRKRRK